MSVIAEFAVQMKCQSCEDKIKESLRNCDGISNFDVSFENGAVVVESNLPSVIIQQKIESAGFMAVLTGYGGSKDLGRKNVLPKAGVAILGYPVGFSEAGVKGVVRFVQADNETCVIEGTIDGLRPGLHGLHIHECGDISRGCESVGELFDQSSSQHGGPNDEIGKRETGDLGNICADDGGRAVFWLEDKEVKLSDVIGRSVVITSGPDDLGRAQPDRSPIHSSSGKRLACGIISRSAGLFENAKKICACDGVTMWDERNRPLAGPGRRQPFSSL